MSPFVSQSQRRWMYSHHPDMAARWQAHTPKGTKLPRHVKRKAFKVKIDNKLKGAYAETDFKKRTIRINRKRHKTKPLHKKRYPEMADTKLHEFLHVKHPKKTEKEIRKLTKRKLKKMNTKQKSNLYSKTTVYKNDNFERK